MEVRVVAGDRHEPPVLVAQLVEEIEAVAPIGQDRAGVIIDLDRVRGGERAPILDRQLRPRGMSHGDEGARFPRPRRQHRPALVRLGAGKIERQSGCDDVPVFASRCRHGVNFCPDQGGEIIRTQLASVGDRPIEAAKKMIGELEEIVARALVGLDPRRQASGRRRKGSNGCEDSRARNALASKRGECAWGSGCRLRGAGSSVSNRKRVGLLGIKHSQIRPIYVARATSLHRLSASRRRVDARAIARSSKRGAWRSIWERDRRLC